MIQDSLSIFVGVLRKKSLDYTCFQFFQQDDFVVYIGTMLELIGYLIPYLEVRCCNKLFPAENAEVYLAFCEIDSTVLEVFLKFLDVRVFENFFRYHEKAFTGLVVSVVDRGDSNTVLDENKVYNLKQGISVASRYLLREAQIKEEGFSEKIQAIRQNNQSILEDHIINTVKALLNLNYSERIKDMFIEQVLLLLMLSLNRQEIFISMRLTLINYLPQHANAVDTNFMELGLISLERPNMLNWRKKFGEIIEWVTNAKATPITPF